MVHALPAAAAQAWLRNNNPPKYRTARRRVEFTSSTTWTCPTGVSMVYAFVVAGGGSGGNAYNAQGQYPGAQGGFGGSVVQAPLAVTPGTGYAVNIGVGGVSSTTVSANGVNGGNSTFGALTATGGQGGVGASTSFTLPSPGLLNTGVPSGHGGYPSAVNQPRAGTAGGVGVDGFGGGGGGGISYPNSGWYYPPMPGNHGGGFGSSANSGPQPGATGTGGGGGAGAPNASWWRGAAGGSGYVYIEFDQIIAA